MPDQVARLGVESAGPLVLRSRGGQLAVRGADHLESTDEGLRLHRLPERAIQRIHTEYFRSVEPQASGVRLAARSESSWIELTLRTVALTVEGDDPLAFWGRIDLIVDGHEHGSVGLASGAVRTVDFQTNSSTVTPGEPMTVRFADLPAFDKTIEIWLPHDVEVTLVDVRADAPLAVPDDDRPVWVNYGSSISHGFNASGPTGIWPAVAARTEDVDLVNLGFSGSALLDSFVAEAIRDRPADVISLEIGTNVVNHDAFRVRTFVPAVHAFLDIIRQGHPTTPVWVVSSVLCPIVEDRPGPTTMVGPPGARTAIAEGLPEDLVRGRLSLRMIRDLLAAVVASRAAEDLNLYHLDGRLLYGEAEHETMPMFDGLHPDAPAQRHIGRRFAELVLGPTLNTRERGDSRVS